MNEVDRLSRLGVASIADVLDGIGHPDQVLRTEIIPMTVPSLAGRAYTWLASSAHGGEGETYDRGIEAVDGTPPDSITMIATGGAVGSASWGELLSLRALSLGGRGTVSDGALRDLAGIRAVGFPVYAVSANARDARSRLRVIDYNIPVICGGVRIHPGDFVLGDEDGVVVIPRMVIAEVLAKAEHHLAVEQLVREQLKSGVSARSAFDEHNVL